ncbi:hypothetical protein [Empedobacter sp. 189-2]|uniref:hypothetical protein n=1 Tax=Empedobacter sp. 189-2 TaxID=2746724 RepID=UPI0025768C0C|nr:hypothetical protein [Empedobacter sp. 189-2]MDM1542370.1 hypothetical protein [Empedobacter sp. 189-2]
MKIDNLQNFINDERILNNIELTELVKALISLADKQDKQIQQLDQVLEKLVKDGNNYVK